MNQYPPLKRNQIGFGDSASVDSFSRLRIAAPTYVFDAQLTYDLAPLLFEQLTANGGGGTATVTHDSTNRCATLAFSSALTGAYARMQSFEHFRYQPGRSQMVFCTFNFLAHTANVSKYVGYSDG